MKKWVLGGLAGIVISCLGCQKPNSIDSEARKIIKNSNEIRELLELEKDTELIISGADEKGLLILVPNGDNYLFHFYLDKSNDGEYDTKLKGDLKLKYAPQKNQDKKIPNFKKKSDKEIFAYRR